MIVVMFMTMTMTMLIMLDENAATRNTNKDDNVDRQQQ